MECLASQAKSSHVKASIKITTKLLTCDQGPAFQAHSLQITLLGPFSHESNVIPGSLNNRVLTIGAVCREARTLAQVAVELSLCQAKVCEGSSIYSNMLLSL